MDERSRSRRRRAQDGGSGGTRADPLLLKEVVGQPAAHGAQALQRDGLRPTMERAFECGPEMDGMVVRQEPPGGSHVARNAIVTLYIGAPKERGHGQDPGAHEGTCGARAEDGQSHNGTAGAEAEPRRDDPTREELLARAGELFEHSARRSHMFTARGTIARARSQAGRLVIAALVVWTSAALIAALEGGHGGRVRQGVTARAAGNMAGSAVTRGGDAPRTSRPGAGRSPALHAEREGTPRERRRTAEGMRPSSRAGDAPPAGEGEGRQPAARVGASTPGAAQEFTFEQP